MIMFIFVLQRDLRQLTQMNVGKNYKDASVIVIGVKERDMYVQERI